MSFCITTVKKQRSRLSGTLLLLAICVLFITACKNPTSDPIDDPTNHPNNGSEILPNEGEGGETSLGEKIIKAQELLASLEASADGADILESKYWVTPSQKWELECAIEDASTIAGKTNAAPEEKQAALETLTNIYNKINGAKQPGAKGDALRTVLNAEIAKAEELIVVLKISADGNDVPPNKEWITSSVVTMLSNAITEAKGWAGNADASYGELEDALSKLTAAYNEAYGAKKKGTTPDKTALAAKIQEANKKQLDVNSSSNDGSDILSYLYWVSAEIYDALQDALNGAISERDNPNVSQTGVNAALKTLENALGNFTPQLGKSQADKTALNALIAQAGEALKNVKISADGSNVYTHEDWVTTAVFNALNTPLQQAKLIAGNAAAPQADVDSMETTLRAALKAFAPQKGKVFSGSIGYTFTGPADETITLSAAQSLSWLQDEKLTVTVSEQFDSYQWIVDGSITGETGQTITLSARDYSLGAHTLTLKVKNGDVPYTKTLSFIVY